MQAHESSTGGNGVSELGSANRREPAAQETRCRSRQVELAVRGVQRSNLGRNIERGVLAEPEAFGGPDEIRSAQESRCELREYGVATAPERLAEWPAQGRTAL